MKSPFGMIYSEILKKECHYKKRTPHVNLGIESETIEFKKSTAELEKAVDNIASMLNKHGHGTVYFGVAPNGDVTGQAVSASTLEDVAKKIKNAIKPMIYPEIKEETIDGKKVVRVDFSGSEKPYSSKGRYFKRVFDRTEEMTPNELKQMMSATDSASYWENNLTRYGLEAVDHEALNVFYRKGIACGRLAQMKTYDEAELLTGLGLFEDGKLTNAGYYLFSNKKPVVLKLAVYVTDERITFSNINRLEDNIFNLIEKGFAYIKEHIDWGVRFNGEIARVEVPEIPIEAVREIIVNSFAHADYRGGSENEIDITPTRVEIYNPGEFPEKYTPEMFAQKQLKSMPRNRVILNTLYKSKDVEAFGSGFRKVYALCGKEGKRTGFSSKNGGFSFLFYRDARNWSAAADAKRKKPSTEEEVFALLKEDPKQTRTQLSLKLKKTVRTIQRALNRLSSEARIRRAGSRKAGYWIML